MSVSAGVPVILGAPRQIELQRWPLFPEDVFIVSYPRSGNTWIRFLLANLKADVDRPIDFVEMERLVPDIHVFGQWEMIHKMPPGRFIKSHMLFDKRYKRVIYVVRDGRDVMVSYYHLHCPRNYPLSFLEFLRLHARIWPGHWHQHVQSWLDHAGELSFLLVRYEDLLAGPVEQFRRIAEFVDMPTDRQLLTRAVENSTFEYLHKMELEKGHPQCSDPRLKFFRKGGCGGWKQYFGPEHKRLFKQQANDVLLRLGYIDSEDW